MMTEGEARMRLRIVEHYSEETGRFLSYELQYKPFWWWPFWRKFNSRDSYYSKIEDMRRDALFLLHINGVVSVTSEFN